mgnify:CR=1 FL=1
MREYMKRIVWLSCFSLLAVSSNADMVNTPPEVSAQKIHFEEKQAQHNTLSATVQALIKASYKEKDDIINSIAAIEDDNKLLVLLVISGIPLIIPTYIIKKVIKIYNELE